MSREAGLDPVAVALACWVGERIGQRVRHIWRPHPIVLVLVLGIHRNSDFEFDAAPTTDAPPGFVLPPAGNEGV